MFRFLFSIFMVWLSFGRFLEVLIWSILLKNYAWFEKWMTRKMWTRVVMYLMHFFFFGCLWAILGRIIVSCLVVGYAWFEKWGENAHCCTNVMYLIDFGFNVVVCSGFCPLRKLTFLILWHWLYFTWSSPLLFVLY